MKIKYIGQTSFLGLTHLKEYDVISIEKDWYRIIDDSGEDYLYPPESFYISDFAEYDRLFNNGYNLNKICEKFNNESFRKELLNQINRDNSKEKDGAILYVELLKEAQFTGDSKLVSKLLDFIENVICLKDNYIKKILYTIIFEKIDKNSSMKSLVERFHETTKNAYLLYKKQV